MTPFFLGVDVAHLTLAAATWSATTGAHSLGTFDNTPTGFAALLATLPSDTPVHLVLEPTGGYELALAHWAIQQGWCVSLPNPKQVRDFAKGRRMRVKTDRQDAIVLARFAAEGDPDTWQPVPSEVAELDSLQRRKDDVEQMLRQERNRQHALAKRVGQHAAVPSSLEHMIGVLEQELAALERQISEHLGRHAPLREAVRRLRTVPGVGAKTVVPLLVLLARWEVLTAGQGTARGIAAYVGLDPATYESGTSVWKAAHISKMGDRVMRKRLYMGAVGGVRGKNVLRAFYEGLVGRGKKKKLAMVAAARKLVVWAWKVYQTRTTFDASRFEHLVAA